MSFRLRVLALLVVVAVATATATAWLTLRQATHQVRASAAAQQQDITQITTQLRSYGTQHFTWDGISPLVHRLAIRTGQRLRLSDRDGNLIADSDLLAGRDPREAGPQPPLVIDPRPDLYLPGKDISNKIKLTVVESAKYYTEARYAECLNADIVDATTKTDAFGIPEVDSRPHSTLTQQCKRQPLPDTRFQRMIGEAETCQAAARPDPCLQRIFDQETIDVAPPTLQLQIGALDATAPTLATVPTFAVAVGVATAVLIGALLLSRRVLRPVRSLTHASYQVGQGDLQHRIPVSGRDEIAQLGRTFNRMAASLQASEARQRQLMADIAHELRTPLTNIRGYLEALRDGVLDPSHQLLQSLCDEAVLQQRLVADLQDLALAEAGTLTYHHTIVDLRELLHACHAAHHPQTAAAGLTLQVTASETTRVHGDWDRLRQVLGNLITNAIRATNPGGTISLTLRPGGKQVAIEVRDTGSGIPADDLPRLFDRFWRADPARSRTTGGSGLGLSIARQFIADHGGTITATSTVGVGTTFTISLPSEISVKAPGETAQ